MKPLLMKPLMQHIEVDSFYEPPIFAYILLGGHLLARARLRENLLNQLWLDGKT
jgi:hypothetical protein